MRRWKDQLNSIYYEFRWQGYLLKVARNRKLRMESGWLPTASLTAKTHSNGVLSLDLEVVAEYLEEILMLALCDKISWIHHYLLASFGSMLWNGAVDRVSDWSSPAVKVNYLLLLVTYREFNYCLVSECNQIITESAHVRLSSSTTFSSSVRKSHSGGQHSVMGSCQPEGAHLFSHTGWCAKKHDGTL